MIKLYKEYVESKRLANLQAKIQIVEDLDKLSFLSKRFILTEYLFTQEQLDRNDELWAEENPLNQDNEGLVQAWHNLKKVGITEE